MVSTPTLDSTGLADLVDALPSGVVTTDPATLEAYRRDWSKDESAGHPVAAVRAESADHVQTAVAWAARHGVPVVPRGAGSGLSGGASAVDGAIVISLERMRAVVIDTDTQVAVVEAGALNVEVKRAAAAEGLWYPPDPSSYEICSIGGNVATNAGGLCCVKYGVTGDYVLGMDVVLADGSLVTLGGKRIKDVAGLSLMRLFVGSEGVLGIVTRVVLRLIPRQTERATLVAFFADMTAASRAVVAIGQRLRPSMMELMDNASVNAVEDWKPRGLDRTVGALMLAQSDAPGEARALEIETMAELCEANGAAETMVTTDAEESEMFLAARRAAYPALEVKGTVLLEDVGAPVPLLPDLVDGIARIAASHGIEIPVVAHAGDGNTHPFIIYDAADPDSEQKARAAFEEVMALAIAIGGTITGEHGVGRAKASMLPAQLGEGAMALNRRVKEALDPQGILNPGAVL